MALEELCQVMSEINRNKKSDGDVQFESVAFYLTWRVKLHECYGNVVGEIF